WQATVGGGQMDVERRDVAAIALRARGGAVYLGLLEGDRIAPIAQGDPAVGRDGRRRAGNRQSGQRGAGEVAAGAHPLRPPARMARNRRGGHLPTEEGEGTDLARGGRARVGA